MSEQKEALISQYSPLPDGSGVNDLENAPAHPSTRKRRRLSPSLAVSIALNLVLLSVVSVSWTRLSSKHAWRGALPPYTPVQDIISYENIRFNKLVALTKWNGPPTDKVDQAWSDLYEVGVVALPKSQARLLPNRTLPFPGDEDNYIMTLDVFHQLHCLDTLRKAIYPERYGPFPFRYQNLTHKAGDPLFDHTDHCINAIRESLMCNADTTALVWKWSKKANVAITRFDVVHQCKKWDDIRDWAVKWNASTHFDDKMLIVDDLKFPDDEQ